MQTVKTVKTVKTVGLANAVNRQILRMLKEIGSGKLYVSPAYYYKKHLKHRTSLKKTLEKCNGYVQRSDKNADAWLLSYFILCNTFFSLKKERQDQLAKSPELAWIEARTGFLSWAQSVEAYKHPGIIKTMKFMAAHLAFCPLLDDEILKVIEGMS